MAVKKIPALFNSKDKIHETNALYTLAIATFKKHHIEPNKVMGHVFTSGPKKLNRNELALKSALNRGEAVAIAGGKYILSIMVPDIPKAIKDKVKLQANWNELINIPGSTTRSLGSNIARITTPEGDHRYLLGFQPQVTSITPITPEDEDLPLPENTNEELLGFKESVSNTISEQNERMNQMTMGFKEQQTVIEELKIELEKVKQTVLVTSEILG